MTQPVGSLRRRGDIEQWRRAWARSEAEVRAWLDAEMGRAGGAGL
jgi:hypothetical protein